MAFLYKRKCKHTGYGLTVGSGGHGTYHMRLYSPDKSRPDISPRLFQGYWATAYLPVALC